MCKPTTQSIVAVDGKPTGHTSTAEESAHDDVGAGADSSSPRKQARKLRVLCSLESFGADERGRPPPRRAVVLTAAVVVCLLFASEHAARLALSHPSVLRGLPPCLAPDAHRRVVARHVGVDALACALCSLLGLAATLSLPRDKGGPYSLASALRLGRAEGGKPAAAGGGGMEHRLLAYHPAAVRTATVFLAYQVKNLYDSYVWGDGPEFLAHHVFSIVTAWGGLYPGCGHYYALFFFGVSEVSTAVLCLLANFDPKHGVPGLDAAYPSVKLALGGAFVALFVLCRCVLWPLYSYGFGRDVALALSNPADERTRSRRGWMRFFLVSLGGLSVLQVAWLGQILAVAREELSKAGVL